MRKFLVWVENLERELELPENATKVEVEQACDDALNKLFAQCDAGWRELKEEE